MAIDTREKRASAANVGLPWRGTLPLPDADPETAADRVQVGNLYSGIAPALPTTDTGLGKRHRRGRMYGRNWRPSP